MSSDIFSRPVDVARYDAIYAGAQKNLAPAGVTLVIVKEEALGRVDRAIPTMLDYRTHVKKGSMFNTPPVLPIFTALQTLRYYKEIGGIHQLQSRAELKAARLYEAIDSSAMFEGTARMEDRSLMNVTFVMAPPFKELEKDFIDFCSQRGIMGIKGHRSVGGFRASLYNALPMESVDFLVEAMHDFESKHK
jgi:phosphoserine aminotransferase